MLEFALPLGHPIADPTFSVQVGRPYRQPLNLPDSNDFSIGLEVFLKSGESESKLFTILAGKVTYERNQNYMDRGKLTLSVDLAYHFKDAKAFSDSESSPWLITYYNVDEQSFANTIRQVVGSAFQLAKLNSNEWNVWGNTIKENWQGIQLFDVLENSFQTGGPAALDAKLTEYVQDVISSNTGVWLNAGISVGFAAATPVPAPTTPPTGYSRYVLITTQNKAGNYIDPAHYLGHMLANATSVKPQRVQLKNLSSVMQIGEGFDHPLLNEQGLNIRKNNVPSAHKAIFDALGKPRVPIPVGNKLLEFYTASKFSKVKWKYNEADNMKILAKRLEDSETFRNQFITEYHYDIIECGETPRANKVIDICFNPTTSNASQLQNIINKWKEAINECSALWKVPADTIYPMLAVESAGVERALRLEKLNTYDINREKYLKILGADENLVREYINLTFNGYNKKGNALWGRGSLTVPDLTIEANLDKTILSSLKYPPMRRMSKDSDVKVPNNSTLTWRQLLTLLRVQNPNKNKNNQYKKGSLEYDALKPQHSLASRISPGLKQTLITTAREQIEKDIKDNGPLKKYSKEIFGDYLVLDDNVDLLFWLLSGRNSLLMGTRYLRDQVQNKKTGWDLLKMIALFNAGSINETNKYTEAEFDNHYNVWGFRMATPAYPPKAGKIYNLIKERTDLELPYYLAPIEEQN